nr:MAG TPA: hypothetical protein [Caudoviricetes sp.]
MSDLKIYDDYNTLPEQVQINKDDIKTNTADIAKLKDDISKIKPNAWEKNTSIMEGGYTFEQYIPTDFNSDIPYSFVKYNIDKSGNPISQNIGLMAGKLIDSTGINHPSLQLILSDSSNIDINETDISFHFGIDTSTIEMKYENNDAILFLDNTRFQLNKGEFITEFSNSDVHDYHQILTAFAINKFYLTKTDASNTYLTKTDASNTYLTKTDASNTYVTIQDYEERLDTGDISFTTQGWTKFNAITDTEGQTIELNAPADLLEHVQVTGINDLKLQLFYNSHAVFENIYLHPNNTIDYLDYITGAKTTYYTGQAILTLSSESDGLFYIVYQEGKGLTLHLITTI